MRRGTNLPRMGDYNQMVVMDQIRRTADGLSRVELSTETGLSLQTISNIVKRLVESGLVVEGERRNVGRGKPRTMLHLAPEGGYAIGAHIDPAVLGLVVVDLAGTIVARASLVMPETPAATVTAIADQVGRLLGGAGIPEGRVLGLGLAVPGPLDLPRGRMVDPPLLTGWGEVDVRDAVAAATGLPVLVEKDVSAALIGELWRGNRMLRGTCVFLYLGAGIAAAFAHDGELLAGTSANAGEVGHLIVDAWGPDCHCGQRGCIGICSSPGTLVAEAVEAGCLDPSVPRATRRELDSALSLVCAAAEHDARAVEILQRCARRVARGAMILADLVDAGVVVLGGPVWDRLAPWLLPAVAEEIASRAALRKMHPVEVLGSRLGDAVGAVGAASLVLDDEFTPRASGLVAPQTA